MKIFFNLKETDQGYIAHLDCLPEFSIWGRSRLELLKALPRALRTYTSNWEQTVDKKSSQYKHEIPYIQRIKTRGYYQSTIHRFQDVLEHHQVDDLDIELIHCLQRKDYEKLLMVSH